MRFLWPLGSLALATAVLAGTWRTAAPEPAAKTDDPWVGTYTTNRGKAETITITKEAEGYKITHFEPYHFKQVKNGVLAGDDGSLGYIYLGSMEFSDGRRGKVLHADFCYEWFYMMSELNDGKKPAENTTTEKKAPPLKVEDAEKLVRDF